MSNIVTEAPKFQIVRPANPESKVYTDAEAYLLRDNMRAFLLSTLSDLGAVLNSMGAVEVREPETNIAQVISMKPMGGNGSWSRSSTTYKGIRVDQPKGNYFVVTPNNIDGAEAKLVQAAQNLRESLKIVAEHQKVLMVATLKNKALMETLPFKGESNPNGFYSLAGPNFGSNYAAGRLQNGRQVIVRPYSNGAYGVEVTSLVAKNEEEMRKIIAFIESLSEAK